MIRKAFGQMELFSWGVVLFPEICYFWNLNFGGRNDQESHERAKNSALKCSSRFLQQSPWANGERQGQTAILTSLRHKAAPCSIGYCSAMWLPLGYPAYLPFSAWYFHLLSDTNYHYGSCWLFISRRHSFCHLYVRCLGFIMPGNISQHYPVVSCGWSSS